MKNVNFVVKEVQRILSSHKISEKYNEQEVFYQKKLSLKILQYSQENNCVGVSFLVKMQGLRTATLLKRDSNTGIFLTVLQIFYKKLF